jgi:GT2 family glycosyltransferase
MQPEPAVSVIISTYNRGPGLADTLASLLEQDHGGVPYEILAVDNNSTDDTPSIVHAFIARSGGRLQYLFEARQGVSYGRNAGIRAARAPLLAFTDDDVIVAPDWVRVIRDRFEQNPDVGYLTGKMLPLYDGAIPGWMTRATSGPCVLRDRGDQPLYSEPGCFFPGWATANIAFRRHVFERVGPFSGDFPRGQDLEFIIRVWRAGFRGMYAPDLRVSHRVTPDRLTKAYHRMWHTREGGIRARVRFREIFDRNNRVIEGEPGLPSVAGIPRFLLREILTGTGRWAGAMLRRDDARAFAEECQLRQAAAYAWSCLRRERPTALRGVRLDTA